jgi:hypothetical protein
MATVKAMTITVDSLLPRPKLDCDVGYDAAVKGASVVVLLCRPWWHYRNDGGLPAVLCNMVHIVAIFIAS